MNQLPGHGRLLRLAKWRGMGRGTREALGAQLAGIQPLKQAA